MTNDMVSDDEVERQLREATRGLMFMSESDYPVEVVRWPASAEVTPEFLRGLAGVDASSPVARTKVEQFFRAAGSEPAWKGATELATARRYQRLIKLLKGGLSGAAVYRVGAINVAVYAVGRGPAGDWLGVSTRVVET